MKFFSLVFILMFLSGAALSAQSLLSAHFEAGFTYHHSAALEGGYQNPSVFMFNPGGGITLPFVQGKALFFRPSGWFSLGTYQIYQGVATPSDFSEADHTKVLGLMLDIPLGYALGLGSWVLEFQLGPSFYFRFPLGTSTAGSAADTSLFWKAFYDDGQFFHLKLEFLGALTLSQKQQLFVGLRTYLPLANLWISGVPFEHGLLFGVVTGIRFNLGSR